MPNRKHDVAADTDRVRPILPPRSRKLEDAVQNWLMESYEMKRPPEVAAKLLAFILVLYQRKKHFPMREDAAYHIGSSVWGVDAALSVAMARKLITLRMETPESVEIEQRRGVIRIRFYTPCEELLELYSQVYPRKVA